MSDPRWRAGGIAAIPYLAMIVGVPFMNSTAKAWFLPEIGMWILAWVVLTPLFLFAAYRVGGYAEYEAEPGESRS